MIMEKEIIYKTPDELGYKDRGKMKWQGLILAAQTELHQAHHEEVAKKENVEAKPEMSEFEIGHVIQQAYLNKLPVNIQASILKNGKFYPDVNCIVAGYKDEDIYLRLKDGRVRTCKIEDIRNIEFANIVEWYEK